jgi:hypothetical protein
MLNSVVMALTIYEIPAFGSHVMFTGLLKAASATESQYMFGVI